MPNAEIPHVEMGWLHPYIELLAEAGAPWESLLQQARLPVLAADTRTALVPTARIYEFVALATRATGWPDLGLRAGSRLDIAAMLPDAERSWLQPGTFRSISRFIESALESSSNVELSIRTRRDPDPTTEFLYVGTFGPGHPAFESVEQYMIAVMLQWVRFGAGPAWDPTRINFRAAAAPMEFLSHLSPDAQIACGQRGTSLVFPSLRFEGPIKDLPQRGSAVWRRHRRSIARAEPEGGFVGSLRIVLPAYLPDGSVGIEHAAALAGMSVRSLQRRLESEGVSYSELLDELRHDLALYLLRDPEKRAADISSELGYKDPAAFTRAFRRWTGQTPTSFRRDLKSDVVALRSA